MVKMSELNIIECPDCKRPILDNVNYCRFCGHTFNEFDKSSGKLSRFIKKSRGGTVRSRLRYCTKCQAKISDFNMDFCENCGEIIPDFNSMYFCSCGNLDSASYICFVCHRKNSKKELSYEEFYQIWHNQVLIPLSNEYDVDLSKSNFKEFFNLTDDEESHIIYIMVYNIFFKKINGNIVEFFKTVLEETRQNYNNLEKALFDEIQQKLTNQFDNKGVICSNTSTIKQGFTETIETPYIKNKHGTGTKVLATAVAGPLGFVATSGVKQETQSKQIHHKGKYFHEKVTLNKNQIIYETYEDDNSSGFTYSMNHSVNKFVVGWEDVKTIDDDNYLILNTGDTIKCHNSELRGLVKECILKVMGTPNSMTNARFMDKYINLGRKNAKKIINTLIKNHISSNISIESKDNTLDISSLEKIINMYEKGLLTEEEFVTMKKNIIGTNNHVTYERNDIVKDNNEHSAKFCGNCGAEIVEGSNFCIQCGNKIN